MPPPPPPIDVAADLQPLLGLPPTSPQLAAALAALSGTGADKSSSPRPQPEPDVKTYPDATYHNYYTLGLSLCFQPGASGALELESIDIFNPPSAQASSGSGSSSSTRKKPAYTPRTSPVTFTFADTHLTFPPRRAGEAELRVPRASQTLEVTPTTAGRDVVRALGEPSRKGAGQGGWVGVWLEWDGVRLVGDKEGEGDKGSEGEKEGEGDKAVVVVGVMLELRDPKGKNKLSQEQLDKGAGGVWEQAAGWTWDSVKVFRPESKK